MLFYNKTITLPNMKSLFQILTNQSIIPSSLFFNKNKISIKHFNHNNLNGIRIWKTKLFMNHVSNNNFIAGIDYTINDDKIKIEFMNINENYELNENLIQFIKQLAKENEKTKVVVDVHYNLKNFNKYYKSQGFKITNRKSVDNPYWLEAELDL